MVRMEECAHCGKEYDVREMVETLNAYDEYTCQTCMRKLEDEGVIVEPRYYADISEVPSPHENADLDEGDEQF